MILLYCFDIEERFRLHGYFRDKGIRMVAVPPSEFRIRSFELSTDAILIAGKTPYGFISEINPEAMIINIGKYSLGASINFNDHTDPHLLELLSSFPQTDESFDYNGILYSSGKDVIYLGYVLKLTPTERAILALLVSQKDRDVSSDEIAGACMGDVHLRGSTISKHISAINAKAKRIGGRTIIYSPENHYYKLHKYI